MNWYLEVLQKKYAEFNGRARRQEFWMFALINFCVAFVIGFVAGMIHLPALSYLYTLAVLVPGIAVAVRRLHDTNRSGWVAVDRACADYRNHRFDRFLCPRQRWR